MHVFVAVLLGGCGLVVVWLVWFVVGLVCRRGCSLGWLVVSPARRSSSDHRGQQPSPVSYVVPRGLWDQQPSPGIHRMHVFVAALLGG